MKKIIILLLIALQSVLTVNASHYYGGEMTWECLNTGRFVFTLKLYRKCSGSTFFPTAPTITNPLGANFTVVLQSQRDISPKCFDPTQGIDCYNTALDDNAIEEFIYVSNPVTLTGVPNNSLFITGPFNARPDLDNITRASNQYYVRAYMYGYQINGVSQSVGAGSVGSCYDSSPKFAEIPASIICTGKPFTYNHNATDDDLDSLDYKWANSWTGNGVPVTYEPGYSFNSPLPSPGVPSDPNNVAATIDPKTGEISYTSFDEGQFVTTVQIDAYKCGQLVASVFRDIPVNLVECDPLPAPFNNIFNDPPTVDIDGALSYSDTVEAGKPISFPISANDNGVLVGFVNQNITMEPTGQQFGAAFSSTTAGCPYPPCAILDITPTLGFYEPPAGLNPARFNSSSGATKGTTIETEFTWQTDCNHLARSIAANGFSNCFVQANTYTFVFKVLDDYCPAPGQSFVTASITVEAPEPLDPPELKCVSLRNNGDVDLSWNIPVSLAEDTSFSFFDYIIYRSSTRSGPYVGIDTIKTIDISSYTDFGANGHLATQYYYIVGRSSCNGQAVQQLSDTLTAMNLTASAHNSGSSAILDWPDFVGSGFPATTTGKYYIWQTYNSVTTLIDSTVNSIDTVPVYECSPATITYFITVEDTTNVWGCTSYSDSIPILVGDQTAPSIPILDSISIDAATGDMNIVWGASAEPDVSTYDVLQNGIVVATIVAPDTMATLAGPIGHINPETITVTAEDNCSNVSAPGLQHATMFLDIINLSRCRTDKNITVEWTAYVGFSVSEYQLWADTGTVPFLVQTFPGTTPTPITYVDNSVNGNNFYTYYVRAVSTTGETSTSSTDTLTLLPLIDNTVVDPPVLGCISILENGDIRIQWATPPNPSLNFDSYIIYYSTDGTVFNVLDSITGLLPSDNVAHPTDTFIHVAPGTGTNHYYQIRSRSGCYGKTLSVASNTLEPIGFSITSVGTNENKLDWQYTPSPNNTSFDVMREYPIGSGIFNNIQNLPTTTFSANDIINICSDSANYRIDVSDGVIGCVTSSTIETGYFKDNVAPAKQINDSISVQDDTNSVLGWRSNPSADVIGYYVIRQLASGFTILDTIYVTPGQTNFSFIDYNQAAGCLATVAFDSCMNSPILSDDFNYHCTIEADVITDKCDQSFLVQWNGYETFETGLDVQYEVFMSTNGSAFNVVGTTAETNFRYDSPISGNEYCFYIQATEDAGNGSFTSTSDSVCRTAIFLVEPEYAYLQYVTVAEQDEVEIAVWVDIKADIFEYVIHQSVGDSSHFKAIETIEAPNPISPSDVILSYRDETAKTDVRPHYYRVDLVDPCGDIAIASNLGKTILLKVEANNESKSNVLRWNSYLKWSGGVQAYRVYRNGKRVGTVAPSTDPNAENVYTDDVSSLTEQSEGLFCYYVEAIEGDPLFPGLADHATSKSNEACVIQYPLFYIPNAFTPGSSKGLNDIFKPEGIFVDLEGYKFEVYDRWGTQVFSTNNFDAGWDGKLEGKEAPTGAYVYFIRFQGADGKEFQQKGTLTLTR